MISFIIFNNFNRRQVEDDLPVLDWDEALTRDDVDAFVICTENDTHEEYARWSWSYKWLFLLPNSSKLGRCNNVVVIISICYRYCGRLYLLCPYYFLLANSLIAQFSFYRKILEHGKHVLVDFPLCLTAEGGKKIFDLAESKGMYIKFSLYNCEIPEYSYRFNVCPWVW